MVTKDIHESQSKKQKWGLHLQLNNATSESLRMGILLAIVGGFLDAYTFVCRGGVFANAQTGNVVLLGINASKGDWNQALIHFTPVIAFIAGVIVSEIIKGNPSLPFVKESAQAILLLEMIILFVVGFIPNTISEHYVNVIISFVSSVQITTFRKLVDSPYSTTMTTGNLRSATQAAYTYFTKKEHAAGIRALRYFIIISSFLTGSFLGALLTNLFSIRSIWFAVFILGCSLIIFILGERNR